MYVRSLPYALIGGLVASGAWWFGGGTSSKSSTSAEKDFAAQYSSSAQQTAAQAIEATRKALVLDQGQLYTADITGDGPVTKEVDDYGRRVLEMVTPDQATTQLRRGEESFLVGRGQGVVRYDVVQLASNDPIEDDHSEKIVEIPKSAQDPSSSSNATRDWMFWGVFDGHSGWTTSAKLRQSLISHVARELNTTYTQNTSTGVLPSPDSIDQAIKRGFLTLDHSIVHASVDAVLKNASKPHAAEALAPALSGSCALLSFYDSTTKTLRVACTGDSRAVLGRRSSSDPSLWTAQALSVDQTGGSPTEAARLRAEHPNEPDVVRVGRVLGGLEPSRAFGDAAYKWSRAVQEKMKKEFFGRTPNPLIKTPPYVTAEPVVTRTAIQPEKGDFVVLATDGLWEMLTNDEVVGLVGEWLRLHPEATAGSSNSAASMGAAAPGDPNSGTDARASTWLSSWFSSQTPQKASDHLPVDTSPSSDSSQEPPQNGHQQSDGQKTPIRQSQWGIPPTTKKNQPPSSSRFTFQDENAATHLIRNALGGKDNDMLCALLTLPSPYSRRYRDDLTVQVVFFGEERQVSQGVAVADEAFSGQKVGRVVPNWGATDGGKGGSAGGNDGKDSQGVKSKL
ncbi:MAG: hypothetical protein Q9162_005525 [Coniocarpon cinnabarinum]